jgi:hypothetical protein
VISEVNDTSDIGLNLKNLNLQENNVDDAVNFKIRIEQLGTGERGKESWFENYLQLECTLTVHGHFINLCGVVLLNVTQDSNVVVLHEVDGDTLQKVK